MSSSHPITNEKIFDSMDRIRIELKDDIIRLENKFDVLAANRITRLENKISDIEVAQAKRDARLKENQATLSTKFVIVGAISLALLYGIANAVANRLLSTGGH